MLRGGSKSRDKVVRLIASCVSSARWLLVTTFAVLLVLSSPLSITSHHFLTADSRKAPGTSITKAKALASTSEKFSAHCRADRRRVTTPPSLLSVSTLSHDDQGPIFRPLRC